MYKYLFYKTEMTPSEDVEAVTALLLDINKKHGIQYDIVDISTLGDEQKEMLVESLRLISRKNGIRVVSRGRGPLPVSRSGQLGNIGILVQVDDESPVAVYPHVMNGRRIEVVSHLRELLQAESVDGMGKHESISEQDILRMISTFPELIGDGLVFDDSEVEIDGGRIDAVFKNKDDGYLLVEIEIEARDNAIGQVQRFVTYSEKYGIPQEKIKLGIVCAKISDSRINACRGAGIDVYQLNLLKLT